jgi:predicted membrane protein (TIGR00267 family)
MSLPAKPTISTRVRRQVVTLRHFHDISGVGELVRRYFALNAFDGVLTTVGVLVGGYLGGIEESRAILLLLLSTAVGMAVSGFYGSYLVEKAERDRAMRELEGSTLSSLQDTDIASASRYAAIVIAVVDGASPFIATVIAALPFLAVRVLGIDAAYYLAMGIAFAELFLLGVFLGSVSRERLWLSGLRLVVAGFIALGISLLLGGGLQ